MLNPPYFHSKLFQVIDKTRIGYINAIFPTNSYFSLGKKGNQRKGHEQPVVSVGINTTFLNSPGFTIRPSSNSLTLAPALVSSMLSIDILSVALYLACLTPIIFTPFLHASPRTETTGRRSGESDRSKVPPSSSSPPCSTSKRSSETVNFSPIALAICNILESA